MEVGSSTMASESITILLAGGEPGLHARLSALLNKSRGPRCELICVGDIDLAERSMAVDEYDVCLVDEALGNDGGLDLIYRTLFIRPDSVLILLADYDDYARDVEVTRAGVAGYLVKNLLTPEHLERSIRYAIERKRIESSLLKTSSQHKLLAAAVENLSVGVLITDPSLPDNPLIFVNPAFTTITGYAAHEALGRNCRFLRHVDSDIKTMEQLRTSIVEARLFRGVLLNRRKDGSSFQNSLLVSPVFDIHGVLTNFVALAADVTARVDEQQQLVLASAIVEGSDHPILGKTLDGTITSWNPAAQLLYGYSAEEMIGNSITRLVPPDRPNEIDEILKRLANGETIKTYETVRKAKDGSLIDVSLTISPMRDASGNVIGASTIAYDIRQRKRADELIERHIRRIQGLRNIDMAITGSLDIRVTLNVVLDQVTTHLQVDSASVLLLNPHSHRLQYAMGRGFRTGIIQDTNLGMGEGLPGGVTTDPTVVHYPNLNDPGVPTTRKQLIAEEGFVCYFGVPLLAKGRVEGVLEIFHRSQLFPDSDWLHFLETLAGQAAIAIENAALFNDLQRSNIELHIAYDTTLEGWSKALDLRDKETEGHTLRVTEMTLRLARLLNIGDEEQVQMRRGALLHDIGKMGVPDSILLKPGPLTPEEWVIMKKHPIYAFELLSPIGFLHGALDIPYCHHEKWDGSGYPRGLKEKQIPMSARIFAVVDVWDALTSDRPYLRALPKDEVRDYIAINSGSHFDPTIVEWFLASDILD